MSQLKSILFGLALLLFAIVCMLTDSEFLQLLGFLVACGGLLTAGVSAYAKDTDEQETGDKNNE